MTFVNNTSREERERQRRDNAQDLCQLRTVAQCSDEGDRLDKPVIIHLSAEMP